MIQAFVDKFTENKSKLETEFRSKHPENYKELIKAVVNAISTDDGYRDPDPDRIHEIDDGDYQGTLVFVIGARGYQPSTYWYCKVGYGSCSGCDTLQSISCYSDLAPNDQQIQDYLVLALHIVQGLKEMGDSEVE